MHLLVDLESQQPQGPTEYASGTVPGLSVGTGCLQALDRRIRFARVGRS